jgi:hypothetical protein
MSRRTKLSRRRERQKRRHALRPKPEPITHVKTAGLIGDILARPLSSRAFDEALQETQHTKV